MELIDTDTLIKRLRYQGRQYEAGNKARGSEYATPHYLIQAADTIEQLQKDKAELIDVIKLVRKHGEVPYIPTEVIDNLIAKHTGSK